MSVIRVNKTKDYTVMSNTHLKEKDMSLKAKGLLSLMFSLPDNWDYSVEGLCHICKEVETAIKSTLDEIKQFGYLEIKKLLPNQTKSGRIEYEYEIYEEPQIKQEGKKQGIEILGVENLGIEILSVENQPQLNTNNINTNKEILNNKINNIYKQEKLLKGQEIDNEIDTVYQEIDIRDKSKENKILDKDKKNNNTEIVKQIIEYLNEKTDKRFTTRNTANIRHINARLKEKYTLDDFKQVIDKKVADWKGTNMEQYLRPETLFGTKFESYLNSAKTSKPKSIREIYNLNIEEF